MKMSIGIMAILAGCLIANAVHAEIVGTTDKEVQGAANPLLDVVFQGLADGNYDLYAGNFDATMKESITPERFAQIRQQIEDMFGSYLYREYLGFLNKTDFTLVLWKGVFDKATTDVLIKLVLSKREGKIVITGLWFE